MDETEETEVSEHRYAIRSSALIRVCQMHFHRNDNIFRRRRKKKKKMDGLNRTKKTV